MNSQYIAAQIRRFFHEARGTYPALSVDARWLLAIRRMELSTFGSCMNRHVFSGRNGDSNRSSTVVFNRAVSA